MGPAYGPGGEGVRSGQGWRWGGVGAGTPTLSRWLARGNRVKEEWKGPARPTPLSPTRDEGAEGEGTPTPRAGESLERL